jgi:hypothetical protein
MHGWQRGNPAFGALKPSKSRLGHLRQLRKMPYTQDALYLLSQFQAQLLLYSEIVRLERCQTAQPIHLPDIL